jgi:hypothetical protein
MPKNETDPTIAPAELLYPFYLDTDMSMAFAAALAGGVALEREDVERETQESEAVRNLRGNLRLFGAWGLGAGSVGIGGDRERKESDVAASESRLVRHHTEASIFIALHDELRRTGRIHDGVDLTALKTGDLVQLSLGPAIAPLRRVVDQIVRLLDVAAPLVGTEREQETLPGAAELTRQQRREQARQAAKQALAEASQGEIADDADIGRLRRLFVALQDDLDRSGMVDIVVKREDEPSVVLTLDKRFLSDQSLELLHTSSFTVIGKVTAIWPTQEDFVNLYRRSVMSLVPALGQTVSWSLLGMLSALARGADPAEAEKAAHTAAGMDEPEQSEEKGEIMLGEDVQALHPGIAGPAIQILRLAVGA